MGTLLLKLYIAGRTSQSERAVSALKRIFEEELKGRYELVVIDVLEHPEIAEEEQVMVTPMLIKELPPPKRRIIGDLTDRGKVLTGLDLERREDE